MGKADQSRTQNAITASAGTNTARDASNIASSTGLANTANQNAAGLNSQIKGNYGSLASDPNKGIDPGASSRLLSGYGLNGSPGGGVNSSSTGSKVGTSDVNAWLANQAATNPNVDPYLKTPEGQAYYAKQIAGSGGLNDSNADYWTNKSTLASAGGAVGAGDASGGMGLDPSYLNTYKELQGTTGGFDPSRLANINNATSQLYDTSGNYGGVNNNISQLTNASKNYGATERSVGGLQDFASTGGLAAPQLNNINRQSLLDMEQTGGYTAADIANERARGNAGISSTYQNLQDNLNRQKLAGSSVGPGWSEAGFKLARQGAQGIAGQTQATDASIHQNVNANKLAAGGKLGDLGLGTAQLQSNNTLTGYNNAGNLDIGKNTAIQDAQAKAGQLGLGVQSQTDAAKEAAAGIDQGTQGLINNTRLAATGGLSSDTLGRIGMANSLNLGQQQINSNNQQFLQSEADKNVQNANQGLLGLYGTGNADAANANALQRGYAQDQAGNSQNEITSRIGASQIPGLGSTLTSGLGNIGKFAGGLAGGVTGLSGLFGNAANGASTGINNFGLPLRMSNPNMVPAY